MKTKAKYVLVLLMAVCMLFSTGKFVRAAEPDKEWTVTYTADGKMDDAQLKEADLTYLISTMQPGDSLTIKVNLKNQNEDTVDWYMWNKVIESLEDQNFDSEGNPVAKAGAYSYDLTFAGPDGKSKTLYTSDTVGGDVVDGKETEEGLFEAVKALEDYFYLFTTKKGESGSVTLYVKLEGETQGNGYQDTKANIQLRFMITIPDKESPNTGDANNPLPYFIAMGVGGVAILGLAITMIVRRRKGTAEEET